LLAGNLGFKSHNPQL